MKLERYLQKIVLLYIVFVMLAITGILSIFDFVKELKYLTESYTIWKILFYEVMLTPQRLYLLFPMECLVGTVMGLAYLTSTNELLAMQVLGLSIYRLCKSLVMIGLGLAFCMVILGEFALPKLEIYSNLYRDHARGQVQSSVGASSLWLKEAHNFIHIGHFGSDGKLSNLTHYHFNDKDQLKMVFFAPKGQYINNHWELYNLQERFFSEQGVQEKEVKNANWNIDLPPNISDALNVEPQRQSMRGLFYAIKDLAKSGQNTLLYQTYFWEKFFKPLLLIIMMLLGVLSAFVPVRSYGFKMKSFVVIIVGFLFYLFNSIAVNLGIAYAAPAWFGPLMPSIIALGIGGFYLNRMR